jgi:hypothetical protein
MSVLHELGDPLPARRALGLEVLGVHEVHAVVDVQLELAAAEAVSDERRGGGGAA